MSTALAPGEVFLRVVESDGELFVNVREFHAEVARQASDASQSRDFRVACLVIGAMLTELRLGVIERRRSA